MDPKLPYSPSYLNALMRPPRICVCRNVPEEKLRAAVRGGAETFEALQAATRCSTGCGTCEPRVRAILADELGRSGGD